MTILLEIFKMSLSKTYSSTDNFLLEILFSDWLKFCYGNLILRQKKKKNENDKYTNLMMINNEFVSRPIWLIDI